MSLSQSLQQKLLQKLSPQQIQLMKLLQVPTANLEERIKEELEENPALEQGEGEDEIKQEVDEFTDSPLDEPADDFEKEGEQDDPFEFESIEMNDYESDDGIADYRLKDDNYPELEDRQVMPYKIETTFHDMLITQLSLLELDERTEKVAEQIVGSIDDDGYLRREVASIVDDLAFRQNVI